MPEALVTRNTFIGGSDAAAVLGLSRWKTPLQVWAEKTGQLPREEGDSLPQELGKMVEPIICDLFTKRTGKRISQRNEKFIHPTIPFLACEIDGRIDGENAFLEAKMASGWKAKEWAGEDIPQEYIIQCMHDLAVTGMQRAYLAVLIGGNQDYKIKIIERDPVLIADLVRKEVSFWNTFVVPKVMPTTITKNDADVLYSLFPIQDAGSEIELTDAANQLIESRQALLQDKARVEDLLDKTDNEIKALLRDKETGRTAQWVVTWKAQQTNRLDSTALKTAEPALYQQYTKQTSTRVLRVKAAK